MNNIEAILVSHGNRITNLEAIINNIQATLASYGNRLTALEIAIADILATLASFNSRLLALEAKQPIRLTSFDILTTWQRPGSPNDIARYFFLTRGSIKFLTWKTNNDTHSSHIILRSWIYMIQYDLFYL